MLYHKYHLRASRLPSVSVTDMVGLLSRQPNPPIRHNDFHLLAAASKHLLCLAVAAFSFLFSLFLLSFLVSLYDKNYLSLPPTQNCMCFFHGLDLYQGRMRERPPCGAEREEEVTNIWGLLWEETAPRKREHRIVTYFSKHNTVWLLYAVIIIDGSFADSVMISCSSGSKLSSSCPKLHLRFVFFWTHEAQKH